MGLDAIRCGVTQAATRILLIIAMMLALTACGTTLRPSAEGGESYASGPIAYSPPSVAANSVTDGTVWHPLDVAMEKVLDRLLAKRFEVQAVEEVHGGRRVTAVYTGDARGLIDCGTARPDAGGLDFPAEGINAVQPSLRYLISTRRGTALAKREIELSLRVFIELFSLDDSTTTLSMDRDFVVSRFVTATKGGAVLARRVDSITFAADDTGRFGNGMSCVAIDGWLDGVIA